MAEKRPWTEEEDRLLKYVFETSKLTKWSHISRILQEQFGIKGRNGKQCKERYTTHIDTSHPKDEWGFEQEQAMFRLHNELGNKWAVIGSKLGGKSDNCVKNHFYSLLRKALRKMNKVIHQEYRRQLKEIKPNVLYRIVEVSEERFKLGCNFQKQFIWFSNQLKNELLEFSYDSEDQEDEEEEKPTQNDTVQAKKLIDKVTEFGLNYKKRAKKQRKSSGQQQDLLTPTRYPIKKTFSENQESDISSYCNSEDNGNNSQDEINRSFNSANNNKKSRRNSADTAENTLQIPGRIRTRANSQDNRPKNSLFQGSPIEEKQKVEVQIKPSKEQENEMQVQEMLNGLEILEEDDNLPPHPLMMKKDTSKYSRFSQGVVDREEYHFFEESNMEMRILPEMSLGMGKDSQIEENIFH